MGQISGNAYSLDTHPTVNDVWPMKSSDETKEGADKTGGIRATKLFFACAALVQPFAWPSLSLCFACAPASGQ